LAVAACARSSPPLPPDLSHLPVDQRLLPGDAESPEAKLDCAQLKAEASQIRAGLRPGKGLDQLQPRADRIDRLSKAKGC
jgi:hypothetical protein